MLKTTRSPAFSLPPLRGGPGLRERNRFASDPVFPAPRRHGEGRPKEQHRSYCHQSRPNWFLSIRETEYAARATIWRLHSASWASRCRYRAESPASGNCQRDKMTSLKIFDCLQLDTDDSRMPLHVCDQRLQLIVHTSLVSKSNQVHFCTSFLNHKHGLVPPCRL